MQRLGLTKAGCRALWVVGLAVGSGSCGGQASADPAVDGALPADDGSCEYGGRSYEDGEVFFDAFECGTCRCQQGEVECSSECVAKPDCLYEGSAYSVGEEFLSLDGCNRCVCDTDGLVLCSREACEPPNPCELPFDVGDCEAAIPVFYFNRESGQCEPEVYGGCGGNVNRFETQAGCESACAFDCPPNSVRRLTCVSCGTDGDCRATEAKCLPVCTGSDDCKAGDCVDGVCEVSCP